MGARGSKKYSFYDLQHKIDWTLNAFAGRNYNDIIFIGGNKVGTGYFRNVGNTQRLGTEFALNGQIGNKWSWFAKYAYVRATFETNQKISSVGHPTNTFDDDDYDDNELREAFQIQIGRGDAIPGISPHIGRVGADYVINDNWSFGFDIEANSAQFYRGDEDNSANKKVAGYFLTNLRTEYNFSNPALGNQAVFFFNVNNLFDENYETGGIFAENEVDGTGGSGTFVTPGQPLSIYSGLTIRF